MHNDNFLWTRQGDDIAIEIKTYELIDDQTIRQFGDVMDELRAAGAKRITIDMFKVEILSSMAICVLVNNHRKLNANGGRLHIRNARATCLEVFSFMRLHELLDIEPASELLV